MKVLVAVDMQNDFVTGSLGTKEARDMVPAAIKKIREFEGQIIYTRDTHTKDYLSTLEGKKLPVVHCIENTKGWELIDELGNPDLIFDKPSFGSIRLGEYLQEISRQQPLESVTLIGLCTDICVISNALLIKAFLPETEVIVDAACCAGVTPESHKKALETMIQCQITVEHM